MTRYLRVSANAALAIVAVAVVALASVWLASETTARSSLAGAPLWPPIETAALMRQEAPDRPLKLRLRRMWPSRPCRRLLRKLRPQTTFSCVGLDGKKFEWRFANAPFAATCERR